MSAVRTLVTLAVVSMLGTAAASAQEYSPRIRAACTGDAKRLCPQQKLGTPDMRYCMEARAQALSRGCVQALEDEGVVPRGMLRR